MVFFSIHGSKKRNAMKYRNPAKGKAGISFNPIFINTQDVDQIVVTATANQIEVRFERGLFSINYHSTP